MIAGVTSRNPSVSQVIHSAQCRLGEAQPHEPAEARSILQKLLQLAGVGNFEVRKLGSAISEPPTSENPLSRRCSVAWILDLSDGPADTKMPLTRMFVRSNGYRAASLAPLSADARSMKLTRRLSRVAPSLQSLRTVVSSFVRSLPASRFAPSPGGSSSRPSHIPLDLRSRQRIRNHRSPVYRRLQNRRGRSGLASGSSRRT